MKLEACLFSTHSMRNESMNLVDEQNDSMILKTTMLTDFEMKFLGKNSRIIINRKPIKEIESKRLLKNAMEMRKRVIDHRLKSIVISLKEIVKK